MLKSEGLRKFGLDIVGEIPWGTHLCEFYQTKEDLIDILVPYFKAGLENNEFCMWVAAEPLNEEEAKKALENSMPDLPKYLERGQIEIISYKDWYVKDGGFNSERVLQGWVSKLENALEKGFAGLRLTGNTFWLEKSDWKAFTDYEEAVNNVIGKYKMIAVCTYSLDKCNAHEIIDVIKNHQFALVKRSGKWELIESSEKKRIADDLQKTEQRFTALYNSMTEGLAIHDIVYDNNGNAVDYVITDVNPSFERITGLSKTQAVGKKASELYGTGALPYLDVYAKVASSGKPEFFETYFPPMQKHFGISVFSQSKGKFTTVFHDITERKVAEEALRASEHRWVTTLASIGDAVIATDNAGKITFMNHIAEGLTGWVLAEASNKPLKEVFCIVNEHSRKEVENPVARVLEKGLIIGLANHTLLIRKDGTEIPIDDSGAPIKDEKGEIVGVVLVFRDIEERRKMEAELSNLAKFPSENPNVILRLSKDGKLLYSNPASKRLLQSWLENLNLSLPEHWRKNVTETLSSGKKLGFEEQIRESTFSFTFAPIVSEGYVNVYAEDITERKKAEEALRQSEEKYRGIVETTQEGILVSDLEGKITFANSHIARFLGYAVEELVGKVGLELVAESEKDSAQERIKKRREGIKEQYEIWMRRKDGGKVCFLASGLPILNTQGQHIGNLGMYADITERKKAEEVILESEERLNRSQEIAHLGSWELDLTNNRLTWSDEAYRIFGLQPQEFSATYEAFLDAVHPDDRAAVDAAYSGSLREGRDTYEIEHRVVRKSTGEIRIVYEKCNHIRDGSGRIIRSVGMVQDITERKKAEIQLQETRDYLDNLLNYANAPIIVWDPEFKIVKFNNAFEKLTGLNANDSLGKSLEILFPEDRKQEALGYIQRTVAGEYWETVEIPIQHKNGTVSTLLWNSANIYDASGAKIIATIAQGQDITVRKEMQKKLEQYSKHLETLVEERTKQLKDAERLVTIGQTAGMVGHDIRNPLQAIMGDVYLAKSDVASMPEDAKKESLQESLLAIEKNADYINKIVADLQDYAKPLRPHTEVADLKAIIDDLLAKNGLPKGIQVSVKVTKEARKVMADSAYVKRIMGNLVTNAVQAMPNGGKLLINAYNEADNAVISVEDTGMGIPDEAKPKLFTPLFTTKSKGQGFGLAVVKRLTEALNGTVTLESQQGKGTKFTIILPQKP